MLNVRSSKMERLYEARIADLKEAQEARHQESLRVIKALAEEVEYLRFQLAGPRRTTDGVRPADVKVFEEPAFMPGAEHNPYYVSEEEEDLHALRDGGHIDEIEFRSALEQLRQSVGGVPIVVES